jgi:hypothetical protein
MTPLDENPNCEEAHATFRLVGDELRVEEATRRLGIDPDFEAAKDEIRRSRMRRRAVRQPTGVWYVSSAGKLSTTSAERHLCWFLSSSSRRETSCARCAKSRISVPISVAIGYPPRGMVDPTFRPRPFAASPISALPSDSTSTAHGVMTKSREATLRLRLSGPESALSGVGLPQMLPHSQENPWKSAS